MEVWFRNPKNYIDELVACGEYNFIWHRGTLSKLRIDPVKQAEMWVPPGGKWRVISVGIQGASEYDSEHRDDDNPLAVYPVWQHGTHSLRDLENWCAHPLSEDLPHETYLRARPGQERRIMILDVSVGSNPNMAGAILELQQDYPDTILHFCNSYSWRWMFGAGFQSVDVDPRANAAKGKITLPAGKEIVYEDAANWPQWVSLLGFKQADLADAKMRCQYNIRSARWASEHWNANFKFRLRGRTEHVNGDNADPVETQSYLTSPAKEEPGDKIVCTSCSLARRCKFYREGSVCSVPQSDGLKLADHFKTRDADRILDGIGSLMDLQAERVKEGRENEQVDGELDPEVTRIINSMIKNGIAVHKLIRPPDRGPLVQVGVAAQQAAITAAPTDAQQTAAAAIAALEAGGWAREDITEDMANEYLRTGVVPEPFIEIENQ